MYTYMLNDYILQGPYNVKECSYALQKDQLSSEHSPCALYSLTQYECTQPSYP